MEKSKSRIIRLEGVVTALTPIAHGSGESHEDENGGVIDENIKWSIVDQKNTGAKSIPIINGNAIRGPMRAAGAGIISDAIGIFDHLNDFRLLWSGGTTGNGNKKKEEKKGGATILVDLEKERVFRQNNPFLSFFGGLLNTLIPGHLRVGGLIPICEQTKHILPDYFGKEMVGFLGTSPLDTVMLTRRQADDNPDNVRYLSPEAMAEKVAEGTRSANKKALKAKNDTEADSLSDEEKALRSEKNYNIRMIRRFEVIRAGTRMYSWFEIFNASDEEIGLLVAILKKFSIQPYIGGRSASGYGRIGADYSLLIDGDHEGREENALLFNLNEGFVLNSQFLADCLEKFNRWLSTITADNVFFFGKA